MIPQRGVDDTRPNVYMKVRQAKDVYGKRMVADLMSDDPTIRKNATLNQLMAINGDAWNYDNEGSGSRRRYQGNYHIEQAKAKKARKGLWKNPKAENPYKFRKKDKKDNN